MKTNFQKLVVDYKSSENPAWLRTSYVRDDGEVFLPCGGFMEDADALGILQKDNISHFEDNGHVYAQATWLAHTNPEKADVIYEFAEMVRCESDYPTEKNN